MPLKHALFLQKPALLVQQRDEIASLFQSHLPQYAYTLADSPTAVDNGTPYSLLITSFLDFLPEVLATIQRPEHIHITGSGTDQLSQISYDFAGIKITHSAGVNAVTIAEHVMGIVLAFAKNFHIYRDQQHSRTWKRYWHRELNGMSIGIIGLGHIGKKTAQLAHTFGMRVLAAVRTPKHLPYVDEEYPMLEVNALASRSDFLVLALPLNESTHALVNQELLSQMKPSSFLVNVSRGGIVDELALMHALEQGQIAGAALDVFEQEPLPEDSPLWGFSNLILTPHVAGTTQYYMRNMFRILAEQLGQS